MQPLDFKSQCKILRKNGFTLGEIMLLTKRPKTTVYFHIRNIPPTKECKEKIRIINIGKLKGRGPKKGKSILGHKYREFKTWTPSLVNLVAHMLFDGAIRRWDVTYYNGNTSLINNFKKKMSLVYSGNPRRYKDYNGVVRISYNNVELAEFFRKKSIELLNTIITLPINYQREFLEAFFDDEGSIDFNKYRVRGYQKNNKILLLVKKLLKSFNIDSRVDARFHEIIISRRDNIQKFAKEINFSKGLRINGSRSNSVWKKFLEKRKILENLVTSYQ